MSGARRAALSGRRQHFQHGPIDLVLFAEGSAADVGRAYDAAWRRFETILDELVAELPLLRSAAVAGGPQPHGAIARRMHAAVRPHAEDAFITPMAAVAGAVAEAVLAEMTAAADLDRAYVNNGGDIALHLAGEARFHTMIADHRGRALGEIAIAAGDRVQPAQAVCRSQRAAAVDSTRAALAISAHPRQCRHPVQSPSNGPGSRRRDSSFRDTEQSRVPTRRHRAVIGLVDFVSDFAAMSGPKLAFARPVETAPWGASGMQVRGIATSGRHGRSHSLGIADSVTVVATSAAGADAAATMIANAVDLSAHPAVTRTPAVALSPDSDLGERLVVTGCALLSPDDRAAALDAGERHAERLLDRGLIVAAFLHLQGETRIVGSRATTPVGARPAGRTGAAGCVASGHKADEIEGRDGLR